MLLVIDCVPLLPVQVMTQIAENGINLYALPDCDEDEDEDYREQCRLLKVSIDAKVIIFLKVIQYSSNNVLQWPQFIELLALL